MGLFAGDGSNCKLKKALWKCTKFEESRQTNQVRGATNPKKPIRKVISLIVGRISS